MVQTLYTAEHTLVCLESLCRRAEAVPLLAGEQSFSINCVKFQSEDHVISEVTDLLSTARKPDTSHSAYVRVFTSLCEKLVLWNKVFCQKTTLGWQGLTKFVLTVGYRDQAFQYLHCDMGHLGRNRAYNLLRQRFYWPRMESDVTEMIKDPPMVSASQSSTLT